MPEITVRRLAGNDLPRLWHMLHEFTDYNFDDSGPRSYSEFENQMADRLERETLVAFDADGMFVGACAFEPFSNRAGMLRGVCFAGAVHGSGVPLEAMRSAIARLHADGFEKISAQMFAGNERAWRFFQKLGAVEEGLLREQATQAGRPVDVRIIAFFAQEKT